MLDHLILTVCVQQKAFMFYSHIFQTSKLRNCWTRNSDCELNITDTHTTYYFAAIPITKISRHSSKSISLLSPSTRFGCTVTLMPLTSFLKKYLLTLFLKTFSKLAGYETHFYRSNYGLTFSKIAVFNWDHKFKIQPGFAKKAQWSNYTESTTNKTRRRFY